MNQFISERMRDYIFNNLQDEVVQDHIMSVVISQIWEKEQKLLEKVMSNGDEAELLEAWGMFRRFTDELEYLKVYFNKIQPNDVYEVLNKILKDLNFNKDEIEDLMSLVMLLNKKYLRTLLKSLESTFYADSKHIEAYLEEKENSMLNQNM